MRNPLWSLARVLCLAVLAPPLASHAQPQSAPAAEPIAEELVVVESSILLQRGGRASIEGLEVEIDGSLAEAVAVYPVTEVELATTVYVDLCTPSFTRLTRAVGMVAAIGEQLLARGPVSVLTSGAAGEEVLLVNSKDALSFEAALARVLHAALGGCEDATPLAALGRMRRALDALGDGGGGAPSLLLAYGFDHGTITADELRRHQPAFAAAGAALAGEGRTAVVLIPVEGDRRLREDEVRSLLPDPEAPPRVINLGAVLGALIAPKRHVPNDARTFEVATDPRNELMRELIGPARGRLFAFPRQLEAFVRELADYRVLFFRSRYRPSETARGLVPIEVRTRSGEVIDTVGVTSRARR